jgi:hypothetical protein
MISHKDCVHESTPSARAKCRRAQGAGKAPEKWHPPLVLPQKRASVKEVDFDNYGQTPRDRDKQCQNCGVERILYRGTDPLTGLLLFVGEKCRYMVKRADDFAEVLD